MPKFVASFFFIVICSLAIVAQNKNFVAGEILIKYKNGTASAAARAGNQQAEVEVLQEFPDLGWQLVKLPENVTVAQAMQNFAFNEEIALIQPNYVYSIAATPNDPSFNSLWGMTKINAPTAWDIATGSENIVVAVIDTGVRTTHEDLAANLWRNPAETPSNGVDDDNNGFIDDVLGWDFANGDADPADDYDHGAHVAGTIGAVGNNSKGVVGVNWNVRLMTLKIHDAAGNSTAAKIIAAYSYIRSMKLRGVNIRVTNSSYGGAPEAPDYDQATKDAIDAAGEADILNCFAAGNTGTNNDVSPFYPASYDSPSILAVAASDSNDNRVFNYGATTVDVAAPGLGILSITRFSDVSYGNKSGTSMATPHVAGAAALLAAAHPNLSAASLKATLMNRVNQLPQWNGIVKANGRLDVLSAIQNPTVCNFNLSATSVNAPASGGVYSVNVTAAANCDFSVVPQTDWILINRGNPGSGNTTVNFEVKPSGGGARTSVIRVGGQNLTVNQSGATAAPSNQIIDFDGDGKTDFSIVQNSGGAMLWHNYNSSGFYNSTVFGLFNSDTLVPADFDGDRKTDFAVWRGGAAGGQSYFYVLGSATNTLQSAAWGTAGDAPQMAQDFNGDNRADFAVTRQINNALVWFVQYSSGGYFAQTFGAASDKPLRGDYDGDGKTDLAVYRGTPANTFFVLKSSDNSLLAATFGDAAADRIVPADYDGDRKTDFAVWRIANGGWYWLESSSGQFRALNFGANGDLPVIGDYDGDGRADQAVWRGGLPGGASYFYLNRSSTGFASFGWGQHGMKLPQENLQFGF